MDIFRRNITKTEREILELRKKYKLADSMEKSKVLKAGLERKEWLEKVKRAQEFWKTNRDRMG